jgi:hypothetical protein
MFIWLLCLAELCFLMTEYQFAYLLSWIIASHNQAQLVQYSLAVIFPSHVNGCYREAAD